MESEKVKEIKKALECCCNDSCENCPYNIYDEGLRCTNDLAKDAIVYINELESENERLNECYRVKAYDKLRAENKKLKNRIAELENNYQNVCVLLTAKNEQIVDLTKENKNKTDTITNLLKKQEFYEKEKLKQFAERLKSKAIRRQEFIGELSIDDVEYVKVKDIDEMLKECLGK